jgi:hypothetical protein
MSEQTPGDDDAILAGMLREAERLCASDDLLLCGQYGYLRDRIRALIELRECFQVTGRAE